MAQKNWHLVSYDVRDPKRLRRVARVLEAYGERIQYSVFRCRLDRTAMEKLKWELGGILQEHDDLLVIPLCPQCAERVPVHSTGDRSDWLGDPPSFRMV
ncbi:MAG: CRISPR-associated endoribonuclease Cas2 [Pirellulaceae bacterium]|nr:MAG: CRISPR-associated endoribonuclease Cas2 [Pirellulaceae bacterium]